MPRTLSLPLGLLALVLGAPAAAEPDPEAELSDFQQAEAYRTAVADRQDSAFRQVLEDQSLLEALTSAYLRPVATSGAFGTAEDGYAYTVDVAWKPKGSMTGITSRLASAAPSSIAWSTRATASCCTTFLTRSGGAARMLGALPPLLLADASLRYGGRRELRRRGLVHWTLEAHQCDRGAWSTPRAQQSAAE